MTEASTPQGNTPTLMDTEITVEPKLTRAMVEQMKTYFDDREETGWYYGNKEQFEKRHDAIAAWFRWKLSQLPPRRRKAKEQDAH